MKIKVKREVIMKKVMYVFLAIATNSLVADKPDIVQSPLGAFKGSFQVAFPHLAGQIASREARKHDVASQIASELSTSPVFSHFSREEKAMIFNQAMSDYRTSLEQARIADEFREGLKRDQFQKDQRLLEKLGHKEVHQDKNGLDRIFPHLADARKRKEEGLDLKGKEETLKQRIADNRADQLVSLYELDQDLNEQERQYYIDRKRYVLARQEHEAYKDPLNKEGFSAMRSMETLQAPLIEEQKENKEEDKPVTRWDIAAKVARFWKWLQDPMRS